MRRLRGKGDVLSAPSLLVVHVVAPAATFRCGAALGSGHPPGSLFAPALLAPGRRAPSDTRMAPVSPLVADARPVPGDLLHRAGQRRSGSTPDVVAFIPAVSHGSGRLRGSAGRPRGGVQAVSGHLLRRGRVRPGRVGAPRACSGSEASGFLLRRDARYRPGGNRFLPAIAGLLPSRAPRIRKHLSGAGHLGAFAPCAGGRERLDGDDNQCHSLRHLGGDRGAAHRARARTGLRRRLGDFHLFRCDEPRLQLDHRLPIAVAPDGEGASERDGRRRMDAVTPRASCSRGQPGLVQRSFLVRSARLPAGLVAGADGPALVAGPDSRAVVAPERAG